MRIYVASSWRNTRQPAVVEALRAAKHDVYDFRNPPNRSGFGWRQCATKAELRDPRAYRDKVLTHPIARAGFASDMKHLEEAEATVLVLPCGRSAHLELGHANGRGQRTFVLLDEKIDEPELMYLMCGRIVLDVAELLDALARPPSLEDLRKSIHARRGSR